jgi:5-aminolevulinate synthase
VIFSDAKNHASMIHGIRNSRTHKHVFRHNDMTDLESQLKAYPKDRAKIIAAVSVYSMDGDFAPLPALIELSRHYNALLFLDEVHAMGLYGPGGAGIAASQGLSDQVDILQGNFAKGYGVVGGYIASTHSIIDFVRSFAPGFIFTTSIPPAVAASCTTSIKTLQHDDTLRKHLFYNVRLLKESLAKTSIHVIQNESHIVPIRVGDAHRCKKLSDALLHRYGFYVQPINYPTVPIGEERLRVTVSPQHTEHHIRDFVEALHTLWQEFQCEKAA